VEVFKTKSIWGQKQHLRKTGSIFPVQHSWHGSSSKHKPAHRQQKANSTLASFVGFCLLLRKVSVVFTTTSQCMYRQWYWRYVFKPRRYLPCTRYWQHWHLLAKAEADNRSSHYCLLLVCNSLRNRGMLRWTTFSKNPLWTSYLPVMIDWELTLIILDIKTVC